MVTGANKGLGFELTRQLAKHGLTTVLTSRDESRGKAAVEALKSEGLDVAFHPLDVQSDESARVLAQWLKQTYGGLDILVSTHSINPPNCHRHLQSLCLILQVSVERRLSKVDPWK